MCTPVDNTMALRLTKTQSDISPISAVVPHPHLSVTISLNTTLSLCQCVQAHSNITPKHGENLLALPNPLTETSARPNCSKGTFISAGARGRPGEEQWTQPPQVSVQSWYTMFQASCCAQVWYCVAICHLCPFLTQWQVALQLSTVSTIPLFFLRVSHSLSSLLYDEKFDCF